MAGTEKAVPENPYTRMLRMTITGMLPSLDNDSLLIVEDITLNLALHKLPAEDLQAIQDCITEKMLKNTKGLETMNDECLKIHEPTIEELAAAEVQHRAMMRYAVMPQAEKDLIFDSGIFNGTVKGYVMAAMQKAGYAPDDIRAMMRQLENTFDDLTAKQARAIYEQ